MIRLGYEFNKNGYKTMLDNYCN